MTLAIGDKAPAFTTTDENGNSKSLNEYKGKTVVLYF
ncbi:MAG: redoxin domain-containing protein [Candidatus Kapabacteria bacterium]|nr:redoxin domain-containing protein [Candidatus Kapabacteria bacterium]